MSAHIPRAPPYSPPADASRRISRPPILNPYDKFSQTDFNAWIGGITGALRHALGQAELQESPSEKKRQELSEPTHEDVSVDMDRDEEYAGDSLAEMKVRRAISKGKARDPREGPGLGEGHNQEEPIEILSDSEDEVAGSTSLDQAASESEDEEARYLFEDEDQYESGQDTDVIQRAVATDGQEDSHGSNEGGVEEHEAGSVQDSPQSKTRRRSLHAVAREEDQDAYDEGGYEEEYEEDQHESRGVISQAHHHNDRADSDEGFLEDDENAAEDSPRREKQRNRFEAEEDEEEFDEEYDGNEREFSASPALEFHFQASPEIISLDSDEEDTQQTNSDEEHEVLEARSAPFFSGHNEQDASGDVGESDEDDDPIYSVDQNRSDENAPPLIPESDEDEVQPLEEDTSFPPTIPEQSSGQQPDFPDPWSGPRMFAEDFYSGGDAPMVRGVHLDPHTLEGEEQNAQPSAAPQNHISAQADSVFIPEKPIDYEQATVEIPFVWEGPEKLAQDFFSGGDIHHIPGQNLTADYLGFEQVQHEPEIIDLDGDDVADSSIVVPATATDNDVPMDLDHLPPPHPTPELIAMLETPRDESPATNLSQEPEAVSEDPSVPVGPVSVDVELDDEVHEVAQSPFRAIDPYSGFLSPNISEGAESEDEDFELEYPQASVGQFVDKTAAAGAEEEEDEIVPSNDFAVAEIPMQSAEVINVGPMVLPGAMELDINEWESTPEIADSAPDSDLEEVVEEEETIMESASVADAGDVVISGEVDDKEIAVAELPMTVESVDEVGEAFKAVAEPQSVTEGIVSSEEIKVEECQTSQDALDESDAVDTLEPDSLVEPMSVDEEEKEFEAKQVDDRQREDDTSTQSQEGPTITVQAVGDDSSSCQNFDDVQNGAADLEKDDAPDSIDRAVESQTSKVVVDLEEGIGAGGVSEDVPNISPGAETLTKGFHELPSRHTVEMEEIINRHFDMHSAEPSSTDLAVEDYLINEENPSLKSSPAAAPVVAVIGEGGSDGIKEGTWDSNSSQNLAILPDDITIELEVEDEGIDQESHEVDVDRISEIEPGGAVTDFSSIKDTPHGQNPATAEGVHEDLSRRHTVEIEEVMDEEANQHLGTSRAGGLHVDEVTVLSTGEEWSREELSEPRFAEEADEDAHGELDDEDVEVLSVTSTSDLQGFGVFETAGEVEEPRSALSDSPSVFPGFEDASMSIQTNLDPHNDDSRNDRMAEKEVEAAPQFTSVEDPFTNYQVDDDKSSADEIPTALTDMDTVTVTALTMAEMADGTNDVIKVAREQIPLSVEAKSDVHLGGSMDGHEMDSRTLELRFEDAKHEEPILSQPILKDLIEPEANESQEEEEQDHELPTTSSLPHVCYPSHFGALEHPREPMSSHVDQFPEPVTMVQMPPLPTAAYPAILSDPRNLDSAIVYPQPTPFHPALQNSSSGQHPNDSVDVPYPPSPQSIGHPIVVEISHEKSPVIERATSATLTVESSAPPPIVEAPKILAQPDLFGPEGGTSFGRDSSAAPSAGKQKDRPVKSLFVPTDSMKVHTEVTDATTTSKIIPSPTIVIPAAQAPSKAASSGKRKRGSSSSSPKKGSRAGAHKSTRKRSSKGKGKMPDADFDGPVDGGEEIHVKPRNKAKLQGKATNLMDNTSKPPVSSSASIQSGSSASSAARLLQPGSRASSIVSAASEVSEQQPSPTTHKPTSSIIHGHKSKRGQLAWRHPQPQTFSPLHTTQTALPDEQPPSLFHAHGKRKPMQLQLHRTMPAQAFVGTSPSQLQNAIRTPIFRVPEQPSFPPGANPSTAGAAQSPQNESPQTPTMQFVQKTQTPVTARRTQSVKTLASNSPVTRSHCRFHKISIPKDQCGPRIFFIVPGCSLTKSNIIEDEEIEDHGDATYDESKRMVSDIESLGFEPYLIAVLKSLVGGDIMQSRDIFYLPLEGETIVRTQPSTTQPTTSRRTASASASGSTSTMLATRGRGSDRGVASETESEDSRGGDSDYDDSHPTPKKPRKILRAGRKAHGDSSLSAKNPVSRDEQANSSLKIQSNKRPHIVLAEPMQVDEAPEAKKAKLDDMHNNGNNDTAA